jgi:hypothetical protein
MKKILLNYLMICLLFCVAFAHEDDDMKWIQDYIADDQMQCCGRNDCIRVDVQVLETNGKQWKVRIGDKILELKSSAIYPSEDEHSYYCYQFSSYRLGDDWFSKKDDTPPTLCGHGEISTKCFRCLFYPVGN